MKKRLLTLLLSAALLGSASAGLIGCGNDHDDNAPPTPPPIDADVIFNVTIPEALKSGEKITIGANINNWTPSNLDYSFTKVDDLNYTLALDLDTTNEINLQYKYTKQLPGMAVADQWKATEKDADGMEIGNRLLTVPANNSEPIIVNDTVASFADPDAPVVHTVVGNLDIIEAFEMPQFKDGRTRNIRVWTPADYDKDDAATKYPVVYMHDGQNLFDAATSFAGEWKVDETITQLIEDGGLGDGAIVVGIDNSEHRMKEYTPKWGDTANAEGDLYGKFIVETLKPYIDEQYNTLTDKDNTMIAGSSMGGLISFATGLAYPDVFGMVGAFSSSFQIPSQENRAAFINSIDYNKDLPRLYLDAGKLESLYTYVSPVSNELYAAGYPQEKIYTLIDEKGTHSETSWSTRFPDAISWLMSNENGNFKPAEAKLTANLRLTSKAASYLDSLAVEDAQILLYTGSVSVSPVFEKIDNTTYKAVINVDQNDEIEYSILFYKKNTIEIFGLDNGGATISSSFVCKDLENELNIAVDDFTKVSKLDLDIIVPEKTDEYFATYNDSEANLILYTGSLANSYYPVKVNATTYNLTLFVKPDTTIKFQTLYYGPKVELFETSEDGSDLTAWNTVTADAEGLVEKTYTVKGWQIPINVNIKVEIPEITVPEGHRFEIQLYGGSFGGSWRNALTLTHEEGNTYSATVKVMSGTVSFTVGYIVFEGDATAPYDQTFDTGGQQRKEVKVAFSDFDPNNIPTVDFIYNGANFG